MISGGEFCGELYVSEESELSIFGGTYSEDPAEWIEFGYSCYYDSDLEMYIVE